MEMYVIFSRRRVCVCKAILSYWELATPSWLGTETAPLPPSWVRVVLEGTVLLSIVQVKELSKTHQVEECGKHKTERISLSCNKLNQTKVKDDYTLL